MFGIGRHHQGEREGGIQDSAGRVPRIDGEFDGNSRYIFTSTPPISLTSSNSSPIPDFYPPVDLERYERREIHFPTREDNPLGAWAWKCNVLDKQAKPGGLLEGKTVALKDCVAVAGVPFLLGTNMIKDYVPVSIVYSDEVHSL